jgi:TonB family protein
MKMIFLLVSVTALLFSGFFSSAQNETADNEALEPAELSITTSRSSISLNFIDLYEINTQTAKKAKVLNDTPLRTLPNSISQQIALIPRGEVIETYKYFPKEAFWAVHYNKKWGFVTTTSLLPFQERPSEEQQKLYDEAPKILSTIHVIYPPEAREHGLHGKVMIKVLISKTGSIKETVIEESIPGLDEAAIEAIRKLKFKPGKYEGKPVEVWIRIPVNFDPGDF